MVLGLLPEIRGGLGALARTGQHSRFVAGYLTPYARRFDEVRYFSYLQESLGEYTDDGDLLARVRLFPGGRWHPWLHTVALALRYRRQLQGCAVVRVFHVTGALPAVMARRLYGVPFVTTYGYRYAEFGSRTWMAGRLRAGVEALGLAEAAAVIVTTPELAAHVTARVPAHRIHVIPNGVDTARFHPRPRERNGARNVLFVGRLAPQKNVECLIAAAGNLVGRFDLRLTVVGDGPLRGRLEALARRVAVPVDFRPVVDHEELPGVFGRADAFVLPSLFEGHPKVLLEAMACGLPCLASDVEGIRSLVTDGTGLLFDPRDPDALAAGLERIFADADYGRTLGNGARTRIIESFDLGSLMDREIALLHRVAAGDRV